MKIIFLDIDGPMIPTSMVLIERDCFWSRHFSPVCFAVLEEMCRRTGAKIVFNTSHNNPHPGIENIDVALIQQGISAEHIHETDRHTLYPDIPRDLAIKEWIARHPEVSDWVAVDDVDCAPADRMILVDSDSGIHLGHIAAACAILGGNPPLVLI